MVSIRLVLDLLALVVMTLAAFNLVTSPRINLVALSLAIWMLARLVV